MMKILVCEDELDSREAIKNILSRRNYEVHIAMDGEESIEKTKELKPDLILLDIRMPKIDGIEVTKKIRKFDTNVKIVFITAFQSPELQKETSKYDVTDYIVKPFSTDDILKVVETTLQA